MKTHSLSPCTGTTESKIASACREMIRLDRRKQRVNMRKEEKSHYKAVLLSGVGYSWFQATMFF